MFFGLNLMLCFFTWCFSRKTKGLSLTIIKCNIPYRNSLTHCCFLFCLHSPFQVSEIFNYSQDDLMTEDMLILDTHAEVFVWIGQSVDSKDKQTAFEIGQVQICFIFFPSCHHVLFFLSNKYCVTIFSPEIHRPCSFPRRFTSRSTTLSDYRGKWTLLLHNIFLLGQCKDPGMSFCILCI